MNISTSKAIDVLNGLIETCRDGEQGFSTAAQDAKDAELARVFNEYALQRRQNIAALEARVRALGGDPEKRGTVSGSLHRGWINLKTALTTKEPHAVLAECERGEDAAKENYRAALLESDLDMETRTLVQRQAAGVQQAHDRIKELRDSATYAHR